MRLTLFCSMEMILASTKHSSPVFLSFMERRSSIALESFCNLYTNHLRQEWNSLPPLRQASVTISMTDEKRLEFSVPHFRQLWSYLFLWVFPQGTPQCLLCLNYVWQWRSDQLGKFCTLWTDIQKLVESNFTVWELNCLYQPPSTCNNHLG